MKLPFIGIKICMQLYLELLNNIIAYANSCNWLDSNRKTIRVLSRHEAEIINNTMITVLGITLGLAAVGSLLLLHKSKHHLHILRAGFNPLKNIYKVLKYSWNHKVSEHRSAFTYWEDDIPCRIDLGRNKYGGPFY